MTSAAPGIEADRPRSAMARGSAGRRSISALQLGLGWFPEHPGGLDRYFFELLGALPAAGVQCRGWVAGSEAAAAATADRVQAFAPETAPLRRRLFAARSAVAHSVGRGGIDLFVSHFALYAAAAMSRARNLPAVVHFHGPWAGESRAEGSGAVACWAKARVEGAVYRRANRIICLSSPFEQILIRDYGIAPNRIRIIPGGVDVDRFAIPESRREARVRLAWPTDRPIVLCVRRLVRRMGLANLIDAAAILRRQVPEALLLIAGRGPIKEELQQQIAAGNLSDHVRLLGYVPDEQLPLAYRAADVTVVPSIALEGFGLVAAESLAAGTPALVTPVGGLPEVVNGLGPQWILPGPSGQQIAGRLGDILKGGVPNLSSVECAAHARARFSWPQIALRIRNVYEEAIGLRSHTDE